MNSSKKILILTSESDQSSNEVIEYLIAFKQPFYRLNGVVNIDVNSIKINMNDCVFSIGKLKISVESIRSFWYRRGNIVFNKGANSIRNSYVDNFISQESSAVELFLKYMLDKKAALNKFSNVNVNKLYQLVVAEKVGIKIPNTLLTTNKLELIEFINGQVKDGVVTKSIHNPFLLIKGKKQKVLMTNVFDSKDAKRMADVFFLTKFQNQIKKQFELRIFYLKGKFYSMAIFSQRNEQTQVDFRNYDFNHPNRNVPYTLCAKIESRLRKLMNELGLDSGSIDMIVDEFDEYYFLEVNPVGQFGMVSIPCNYYLEKKIAKYLMRNYD